MTRISENANGEREKGERSEESEEEGIQGARGSAKTNPIIEKDEDCCVIEKKHHRQDS